MTVRGRAPGGLVWELRGGRAFHALAFAFPAVPVDGSPQRSQG